jgi:hypothetical protein
MNVAESVIEHIEGVGGVLSVNGERIRVRLPEDAAHLLQELRAHRDEVLSLLRRRAEIPAMPPGVRLTSWKLKEPPIAIETCAIVTNPGLFARSTLEQLGTALSQPKRWVGWTGPQLIDRLAQVGVIVSLKSAGNEQ